MCPHCIAAGVVGAIACVPAGKYLLAKVQAKRASKRSRPQSEESAGHP